MQRVLLAVILLLVAAAPIRAAPTDGPDELLTEARKAFYEAEDMVAAEALYRAAAAHPDATDEQRALAGRMVGACLGRQEKFAEAVSVQA